MFLFFTNTLPLLQNLFYLLKMFVLPTNIKITNAERIFIYNLYVFIAVIIQMMHGDPIMNQLKTPQLLEVT